MGAITATKVIATEFAGEVKTKIFTVTPAAASDTVDLSSYFTTIYGAFGHLEAGMDANLTSLQISFSTTTVTIVSKGQDGAAATDWTSASVRLLVLGVE